MSFVVTPKTILQLIRLARVTVEDILDEHPCDTLSLFVDCLDETLFERPTYSAEPVTNTNERVYSAIRQLVNSIMLHTTNNNIQGLDARPECLPL